MKKLLVPAFALTLLVVGCAPDQPKNDLKAQTIITTYLKKSLSHPDSYKPVSFTTLDSSFDNLAEHPDPTVQYPKIFIGFKMSHDYTADDILGNKAHAERQTFFFDPHVDSIIAVRDTVHTK